MRQFLDPDPRRARVAGEILRRWTRSAIPYAVVHGLEGYPDAIGHDLDVIIAQSAVDEAVSVAIAQGSQAGFTRYAFRWSAWGLYQLSLIDPTRHVAVPLDLICTVRPWRARAVPLAGKRFLRRLIEDACDVDGIRVSPSGRFIKERIKPVLVGRPGTSEGHRESGVLLDEKIEQQVRVGLGDAVASRFLHSTLNEPDRGGSARRWFMVRHPARAFATAIIGLHCRCATRVRNRAGVLLVRPGVRLDQPQRDAISRELRRMFIDARIVEAPQRRRDFLRGYFLAWRRGAVSEFNITIVLIEESPVRKRSRPAGASGSRPVEPPEAVDSGGASEWIVQQAVDFVAGEFSDPATHIRARLTAI